MRTGLHGHNLALRAGLFAAGAGVLFAYGVVVNSPPWDFGRLLGVYVTLFFLIAQAINLLVFGVRPDLPILVGGRDDFERRTGDDVLARLKPSPKGLA